MDVVRPCKSFPADGSMYWFMEQGCTRFSRVEEESFSSLPYSLGLILILHLPEENLVRTQDFFWSCLDNKMSSLVY